MELTPAESELERKTREDFEAAEKAYRAFRAEYNRLAILGGTEQSTARMKATAGGPYLQTMSSFLQVRHKQGWRSSQGISVGYVRPGSYAVKQLELQVCEDGRKSKLLDASGKAIRSGTVEVLDLEVRLVGNSWKIWNGVNKAVKSCED